MPPSSDSDQRRWGTSGGLVGEEDGSDGCSGTVAAGEQAAAVGGARGGHQRGSSGNNNVSREWQAEQDMRRSKEWQQVNYLLVGGVFRSWCRVGVDVKVKTRKVLEQKCFDIASIRQKTKIEQNQNQTTLNVYVLNHLHLVLQRITDALQPCPTRLNPR